MPTLFQTFNAGDVIDDTHFEQFITPIQNIENGTPWMGTDTGTTNAFEIDLNPVPTAYTPGMRAHFLATNDVTGASTLNVNSLGAKPLLKEAGTNLASGDIVQDQMVLAIYDGTNFRVVSPVGNATVNTPPAKNVLVYSDVVQEHLSSTVTSFTLPSFSFNGSRTYLLEMVVAASNNSTDARVTLSNGINSYAYPGAATTVMGRDEHEAVYRKILPNLSGSHSIVVTGDAWRNVKIRLYEVHDNLVYADFTPQKYSGTTSIFTLAGFTATPGHTYLMSVLCNGYSNSASNFSAYLTGPEADAGIPGYGPKVVKVTGKYRLGTAVVERILTGLSGPYGVIVRASITSGVCITIHDIT